MGKWPWKKKKDDDAQVFTEEKRKRSEAVGRVKTAASRLDEVIEQMRNTQEERRVRSD